MCNLFMALTAEKCAANYSISRAEQDVFAIRSQTRAEQAWQQGRLVEEVVPVEIKARRATTTVDRDDSADEMMRAKLQLVIEASRSIWHD